MIWIFDTTEKLNPILRATILTMVMVGFFVSFAAICSVFVQIANHYTGNGGWGALGIMFLSTFAVNLYFCLDWNKQQLANLNSQLKTKKSIDQLK